MPSIPRPTPVSQPGTTAVDVEVILGVDTHKENHVAAAVTELGLLLATAAFPATAAG